MYSYAKKDLPSGEIIVFDYILPESWSEQRVISWLWKRRQTVDGIYHTSTGWHAPQYNDLNPCRFECGTISARKLFGGDVVVILGRTIMALVAVMTMSCAGVDYYREVHYNKTKYRIETSMSTPKGIRVDPGGHNISYSKIDRYTNELETCLGVPIRRNAFVVKFPTDVYRSPCSGAELFPCNASDYVCRRKVDAGMLLLPDSPCTLEEMSSCVQCPCACRGAVQNNWAIIVTPDMVLYKATLASLVLEISAAKVWGDKEIAKCL